MISLLIFGLVLSASTALVPRNTTINVVLQAPSAPPEGHNVVDASFQSYSIEFNYMLDYAGNKSHPNKYSIQMMKNFQTIAGAYPYIRAGGSTQNRNWYYDNQTKGLIETFTNPWDDQPNAVSTGPKWFESFQQFPNGTKYIYGLNFYDGESGLENAVAQATPAYLALGDSLYAYEIGNEPNGWAGTSRRPANWTFADYVAQWTQYAEAVKAGIQKQPGHKKSVPGFQGGAFLAPRAGNLLNSSTTWSVANAVRLGMGSPVLLRTVADHEYMGSNCASATVIPTLNGTLLNHYHMTSIAYFHEQLGKQTKDLGVPYSLGETNSISCQGIANISDVFGSALWGVDYALYIAGLNIERLHFHMGTPYRYSPWQPITINDTAPFAKPLYYGNLFTAAALAGGNKSIVSLVNETTFAAYGIYESSLLTSVAIVNLEMWNSTQATERPYETAQLPGGATAWKGATARRLTAPGVEVKTGMTFAGISVGFDGKLVGKEKLEDVGDGLVLVGAGEAVLVSRPS